MIRPCAQCGRPFEPIAGWARLCKPCYIERKNREQYDAGYDDGYRAGHRASAGSRSAGLSDMDVIRSRLDTDKLRALRLLTHPDAHGPARHELATKVTAWINNEIDRQRSAA